MLQTRQPAVVLAFNATTRRSDRRRTANVRWFRRWRRVERRELIAEAAALGIAVAAFEADENLRAHCEAVHELETAYAAGAGEGRRTLLGIINRYFEQGYEMACDDSRLELRRQVAAAVRA